MKPNQPNPEVYWKFTTANAFKSVLRSSKVKIAPAIDLNDPGEFKFTVGDIAREEFDSDLSQWEIFSRHAGIFSSALGRQIVRYEDFTQKEKDELYGYVLNQIEMMRGNARRVKSDMSRLFGVFSCCQSTVNKPDETILPIDNPVMWAHYAHNHFGIAYSLNSDFFVETQKFKPVAYLKEVPALKMSMRFVEQMFPNIGWDLSGSGNFERIVGTKHVTWEYESETRALYPIDKAEYIAESDILRVRSFAAQDSRFSSFFAAMIFRRECSKARSVHC